MSKAKFWQMIGRGTRLCPELMDGEDKDKFYIFDSEDVSIKSIKADDVRKKLREGKYIYENEKQKMEELEEK